MAATRVPQTNTLRTAQLSDDRVAVYNRIPYVLIGREVDGSQATLAEFQQIMEYYRIYRKGVKFATEASMGDYVPSTVRFKLAAGLVNKQARFMFAETPDVSIGLRGDRIDVREQTKRDVDVIQEYINRVLEKNCFEDALLKGSKDAFIGKRVACVLNFNGDSKTISMQFIPSVMFVHEYKPDDPQTLSKFVYFITVKNHKHAQERRIYKKKFVLKETTAEDYGENNELEDFQTKEMCWAEEAIYDGAGVLIEQLMEPQPTLLESIPAYVFVNDGLTCERDGESEIELIKDYEQAYSKMSNADIDAERKGMHPTRYLVDMAPNTTKGLSVAPGSLWDLASNQNVDKSSVMVGLLEPSMSYSAALKETLARIKASAYGQVEMPDVSFESMTGVITSGKALKAVYWPLIVRCKEKFKMWGPGIRYLTEMLIEGAKVYPECAERYTNDVVPSVEYEVNVLQNFPLPEDENEEKQMDLAEVAQGAMSHKAYMEKWRELSNEESDAEIEQIAFEKALLENSAFDMNTGGNVPTGQGQQQVQADERQAQEEIDAAAADTTGGTAFDDFEE